VARARSSKTLKAKRVTAEAAENRRCLRFHEDHPRNRLKHADLRLDIDLACDAGFGFVGSHACKALIAGGQTIYSREGPRRARQ
jgi:hypothetical protein